MARGRRPAFRRYGRGRSSRQDHRQRPNAASTHGLCSASADPRRVPSRSGGRIARRGGGPTAYPRRAHNSPPPDDGRGASSSVAPPPPAGSARSVRPDRLGPPGRPRYPGRHGNRSAGPPIHGVAAVGLGKARRQRGPPGPRLPGAQEPPGPAECRVIPAVLGIGGQGIELPVGPYPGSPRPPSGLASSAWTTW